MTELAAARTFTGRSAAIRRVDTGALSTWFLAGGLVLYLALDGGGYDLVVHSQVGIVIWWIVLIGAAWGVLPARRLTRAAWAALALFGTFVAWTALGTTWSLSSELSLDDLSLVAGYLGVLALAIGLHRDREAAVRQTVAAIASAIAIVAAVAVVSRLYPSLIPSARQTASFLGGVQSRLSWPLNYWNALAALMALGLPLLLAIATSARTLRAQAAAAGAIPLVVLCAYLTFSRGGALEGACALIVFVALAPDRIPKLATALVGAAGSVALIAGAIHRSALEQGLSNASAHHQGATLLIAIVLVCGGVALAQVGIGFAVRHGTPPRWLVISRRHARWATLVAVVAGVIIALAAGAPARLSHAWSDFKKPEPTVLQSRNLSRFSSVDGNGRYNYWKVALNATSGHVLAGSGPGTYQLLWLPRAPYESYVVNAHSLYFETLAETGVVGLALVVGLFVLLIGAAIRHVGRTRHEARARAAAVAAALVAFAVSAGVDWVWQLPVLPAAFLLLGAAVLAPVARKHVDAAPIPRVLAWTARIGAAVIALACLVAITVPLAATTAVRRSQAASASGDTSLALTDARDALRIEPGAESAQLQVALVLEEQHDFAGALIAVRRATADESTDWSAWLVRSRIEAETGHQRASLQAYLRARSLNPRSPLFAT
jgi:O-antigen ligase